eukprot:5353129-Prorocentrum_lima.AAC.1
MAICHMQDYTWFGVKEAMMALLAAPRNSLEDLNIRRTHQTYHLICLPRRGPFVSWGRMAHLRTAVK